MSKHLWAKTTMTKNYNRVLWKIWKVAIKNHQAIYLEQGISDRVVLFSGVPPPVDGGKFAGDDGVGVGDWGSPGSCIKEASF